MQRWEAVLTVGVAGADDQLTDRQVGAEVQGLPSRSVWPVRRTHRGLELCHPGQFRVLRTARQEIHRVRAGGSGVDLYPGGLEPWIKVVRDVAGGGPGSRMLLAVAA